MKLLFNQNISHRIINLLPEEFSKSEQVRTVNLEGATDFDIWNFARENRFSIVTFDADFADIAYLKCFPPKIIWLRTGNMTTLKIAKLFKKSLK